jgi:hypothetical protein
MLEFNPKKRIGAKRASRETKKRIDGKRTKRERET